MDEQQAQRNPQCRKRALGGTYLTLFLGSEEYGLEILKVREIISMLPVTRVPGTAEHVRGVINLRGKVVPVLDLRQRLGMGRTEESHQSCIVVVRAHQVDVGLIVDRVSEVVEVPEDRVDDTPDMGPGSHTEFILGIAKGDDRVRLLLDIDEVLDPDEARELADAGEPVRS